MLKTRVDTNEVLRDQFASDLKYIAEQQVIEFRRNLDQETFDVLDGVRDELTETVAAALKDVQTKVGEQTYSNVQDKMTKCIEEAFNKAKPRSDTGNHNSSSTERNTEHPTNLDRARALLAFSIVRRLRKSDIALPIDSALNGAIKTPGDDYKLYRAVAILTDDFNDRYEQRFGATMGLEFFRHYSADLHASVLKELFLDDHLNWGRIVATLAFAGYAAEGWLKVEGGHGNASPDLLVDWTVGFFQQKTVAAWIAEHEGWSGLVNFFEHGPVKNEPVSTLDWVIPTAVVIGASVMAAIFFWVKQTRR